MPKLLSPPMGKNPYSDLPKSAFWKTGVAQENPYAIEGIYNKKFDIPANAKIATAGSCFAQHISRHLKKNGYNVLDVEPPPPGLPENLHQKFGFSMYSARYGNIYTVRQLLQLAQEVAGEWTPQNYIWEKNGKFYDALRPAVEPEGVDSPEKVIKHRYVHVSRVKELFESLDLFIFTLGLTEMWVHKESGTVYPTAPGTLAGDFDDQLYEFQNAQFSDIIGDFILFQKVLEKMRGGKQFKCLLTVSPVPLTATANEKVVKDAIKALGMRNPFKSQSSFNRVNLNYDVRKKDSKVVDTIADYIAQRPQDCGVIYCLSRKNCEEVSEKLQRKLNDKGCGRVRVSFYHAELDAAERERRHHAWSGGRISVLCATVAFGMGIDKPGKDYLLLSKYFAAGCI